jgi:hypothetical protein
MFSHKQAIGDGLVYPSTPCLSLRIFTNQAPRPKKKRKNKQKFKFEIRLAVICLQCGKNKSQVREIWGGKKKKA